MVVEETSTPYSHLWYRLSFISICGFPCISVPIEKDEEGFPVSLTFIAKRGEDLKLLECANVFQKIADLELNPPLLINKEQN